MISVKRSSGIAPTQIENQLLTDEFLAQVRQQAKDNSQHLQEVIKMIVEKYFENSSNLSDRSVIDSNNTNNNVYGHEVEIPGGCRVVYNPKGLSCGAKVWIETFGDVKVICWD